MLVVTKPLLDESYSIGNVGAACSVYVYGELYMYVCACILAGSLQISVYHFTLFHFTHCVREIFRWIKTLPRPAIFVLLKNFVEKVLVKVAISSIQS